MKKIFLNLILFSSFAFFLSGCSTLTYVGEDFEQVNVQTIKTNEDFVFDVYKKSVDNVNIKTGVSKTPIPEILCLYVQIENLSYETPYIFKVEDLRLYDSEKELQFITSNNYLNIYQTQEANSMASMSSLAPALTNMTGMMTNYNDFNQSVVQNSSKQTTDSAFSRMEEIGNQILNHSVKFSSTVSPRKSQYLYFFFEDSEKSPYKVKYKNLEYQFKL